MLFKFFLLKKKSIFYSKICFFLHHRNSLLWSWASAKSTTLKWEGNVRLTIYSSAASRHSMSIWLQSMAKHLRIQHRRHQRQHRLSCPNHQHHLERDGMIDGLRRFCWHRPIVERHLDVHEPVRNERHVSMSMEQFPMANASMCASIQCPRSPSTCICTKRKTNGLFIAKCHLLSVLFHSPVVVSPGELWTDQSFRLKRLHRLDDVQVWNIFELWMSWSIEILLCDHNTLLEEMLVDSYAMLLWHKHSANDMRREQIRFIEWNQWDNWTGTHWGG